jgi:ribonucleoside-diphosphate reductase alpha chain
MKTYKVLKKSGARVPYDPEKIRERIELATNGLNVNPLELETYANLQIRNGITTNEIQKSLINSAVSLSNITENGGYNFDKLDWRFVAARLLLQDIFKEASISRKHAFDEFGYNNYYKFVKKAVSNGLYDKTILQEYTKSDICEFEKEITLDYDYGYDYAAMNLLSRRYLIKQNGQVFELPQEMYATIALLLAVPEKKEDRLKVAVTFYHRLASRKISLATPILLNLRKPNGNLSSCFIGAMDDSLTNIDWNEDALAQISKNGGGVGINVSRLRANGSWIKGHKGASGGVIPWVKKINDIAIAVNQLGSRAGAITTALDIWHYDVLDFLEIQTEAGDPRQKAFDVFPQIVMNDVFMERAIKKNRNWTLFDPWEVKEKLGYDLAELYGDEFEKAYLECERSDELELKQYVKANELLKTLLKTVVETGLPYVFFKDHTNNVNPNKHSGMIGNANLCVESFSNFKPSTVGEKKINKELTKITHTAQCGEYHVCNLVSQNLAVIDHHDDLAENTKVSVRILDNTIELTAPPVPEAARHNSIYRIIGVGAMGLADYFAKNNIIYDKNGPEEAEKLFELIGYHAVKASHELGLERGSYPMFEGSEWSKGIVFGKDQEYFKTRKEEHFITNEMWIELLKVIPKAFRNGGLLAIAPNTSTALMMGASASVLAIYKKFFMDKSSSGTVPIVPPFFNQQTMWSYKESKHIHPQDTIKLVSGIQSWTDQGISMELLINLNRHEPWTAKELRDLYKAAWEQKCKTVYYVRSIAKKENSEEACESCAS